jgi:hypothetical protein
MAPVDVSGESNFLLLSLRIQKFRPRNVNGDKGCESEDVKRNSLRRGLLFGQITRKFRYARPTLPSRRFIFHSLLQSSLPSPRRDVEKNLATSPASVSEFLFGEPETLPLSLKNRMDDRAFARSSAHAFLISQ